MNLHHFIYADASSSLPPQKGRPTLRINQADADTIKRLSPSEQAAWKRFVAYYAANYVQRDLQFDDLLYDIKVKLESAEASADLKGADIPAELKSVLLQAAPIYRKYWWKQHDAENRRWAWPEPIRSLIIQDWKPHLDGSVTLNGAVTKLVNDLAASH
jgi:hypothetical protein